MKVRAGAQKSRQLTLEKLEERVLLSPVNPGEPAELQDGDQLFFVQGEVPEPGGTDGMGPLTTVIIVSFDGPGYVRFQDSLDHSYTAGIPNGGKIGDVYFYNVTEDSSLLVQTGVFLEGFSMGNVYAPVSDLPDAVGDALSIAVPPGESGAGATYNTGRLVVSAAGESSSDWVTFAAQEAEQINVTAGGDGASVGIYTKYGPYPMVFRGVDSYNIGDDNANGELDDVAVFLHIIPTGGMYNLIIDRVEQNGVLGNVTVAEDLPDIADKAVDLTYSGRLGLGPPTPTLNLFGEGGDDDYFKLTLRVGETLNGANFSNVTQVRLLDTEGTLIGELIGAGGEFTNPLDENLVLTMDVVSSANWSFDISVDEPPLSNIVMLNIDSSGNYIWWSGPGSEGAGAYPWMEPPLPGMTENVRAPVGSGGAVITGNVHFNDASTGLERFALDGSLKGSIGMTGDTLDQDETIQEIMVGYIHGYEGGTRGGVNTVGDVERLLVRTSVAGAGRQIADIDVGGYLLDFQVSGGISSDITVGGVSSETVLLIDTDYQIGSGELNPASVNQARINDTRDSAFVVGSPGGDFDIKGSMRWSERPPSGKWDPQDWYVFNAGLGEEINISMTVLGGWPAPAWVYAPSGRIVAYVDEENSATFEADEGGNYYILVGRLVIPDRAIDREGWDMDYRLAVRGAAPVGFAGVVAGSDIFGIRELEAFPWFTLPGFAGSITANSMGFLDLRGEGDGGVVFGVVSVDFNITGDLGFVTSTGWLPTEDYKGWPGGPTFVVGGNIDRLETRLGHFSFDGMTVGGNLGEVYSAGFLGHRGNTTRPIFVQGAVGSVVAEGDFWVDLTVHTGGLDLLYVGGDFGSRWLSYARVAGAVGVDVGFAYVGGTIYHEGLEVMAVPVVTQETFVDDGGAIIQFAPASTVLDTPATLSYRYLPVDSLLGPVGATITEITASDSLTITAKSGRVDLGYVRFGSNEKSYLEVKRQDSLAECDIYFVEALSETVARIVNDTNHGDIVNANVGSVGEISTGGHIGISERFLTAGGRLINPGGFAPDAVTYVTEENPAYFNGIIASGDVGIVEAGGSIGDVYVTGSIGEVTANADGVTNGTLFTFRSKVREARTWDGIAGVVYAGVDLGVIDTGAGLYGGMGEVPIGGVFTGGIIEKVSLSGALIEGPIFASGGIVKFNANQTVFHNATIGAGASYSDWALWDNWRMTTQGVRFEQFSLTGTGTIIDESVIQVGVLNKLTMSSDTSGFVDSHIWAVGDPITEEGINQISIQGGGMDGTGLPPCCNRPHIESNQIIKSIDVKNCDMTNLWISSLKSIGKISVKGGDIRATPTTRAWDSRITAPLGIGTISTDNITGAGSMYIGAAQVKSIKVAGNVTPDITTDGGIVKMDVKGSMSGNWAQIGPNGYLGKLSVGMGLSGDVDVANYIGSIDVKSGNLSGDVIAGGSNSKNVAISSIKVKGGSLTGDVMTEVNVATVRPGGGIGTIDVGGDLTGDIITTSYYNPVTGLPVRADIKSIKVKTGDMSGWVLVTQNAPLDARDPGGNIGQVSVKAGTLSSLIWTDKGSLGTLDVFTANGALVDLTGNLKQVKAKGSILNSSFTASGALSTVQVSGNYTDTSIVAETIGKVQVKGTISGSGGDDVIDATNALSSFQVSDATQSQIISALNNHVNFAGVDAYVG